ncbi:MAG: adenylate kinase [Alteromonadaceae bacterium]|nr:adenylate kinase [Alteromonadaceae bacterium]
MKKIVIIGTSCSGKSTLAVKLSKILKFDHIELDELHWLPNWQEREDTEFCRLVDSKTSGDSWVVSGNYSASRDILWDKADTIIWLNYPFTLIFYRALVRCFVRASTRQKLFAGNVETFRHSFLSKESILLWVLKTYHANKRKYLKLLNSGMTKNKQVFIFKKQNQLDQYLSNLTPK